jgi:hypothetical protein
MIETWADNILSAILGNYQKGCYLTKSWHVEKKNDKDFVCSSMMWLIAEQRTRFS